MTEYKYYLILSYTNTAVVIKFLICNSNEMGHEERKIGSGEKVRDYIEAAVQKESHKCEECCKWLQKHMPPHFFQELPEEDIFLIAHALMGFDLQEYFAKINLKDSAIVLCLNSQDADLRILKYYQNHGIKNYRTFVSDAPPPFPQVDELLRIAIIHFTLAPELEKTETLLEKEYQKELKELVKARNPSVTDAEFKRLLSDMSPRFVRAMTKERMGIALDMYFRAQTRDHCQYEVVRKPNWEEKKDAPSLQIILAWRNVPKHHFLYKLARVVFRHGLTMRRVAATYIDPYSKNSILIMSIGLHGAQGKPAWEEADISDFLKEFVLLKYFEGQEIIEQKFVENRWVSGNLGNLIKAMSHFIHQTLTHADENMYSLSHVEEALCHHPELTVMLTAAFECKFNPSALDLGKYEKIKKDFLQLISDLDTGNVKSDTRRKNILYQGMNFVDHILKTNFYRNNKTAFSFRLDPAYLDFVPYDRYAKFPELPFAIFFTKGMYYLAFHIRFKDLSRGGLRTVFPQKMEQMVAERNNLFSECYNLAYTQQKKNKDIPEGGAKGVIFLEPYDRILSEEEIYKDELEDAGLPAEEISKHLAQYRKEQKLEYLYSAQRSFVESLVTLLNCEEDGTLRAKHVVDYWKRPEYIYLGPDENMHNEMIEWIAAYAKHYNYKPGGSFISSKPSAGINHKEYGVTSYGVNVCVEEVLRFMGIEPKEELFTIKISGGPDGDVAGNEIVNLHKFFPKTAKLLAITDVSGTIFDPKGLDLTTLVKMFEKVQSISFYPPEMLSDGGFLLDLTTKKEQSPYAQQTLLYKKSNGKVVKEWLSGSEMNHLFRSNVHQTKTDIFVPAGGRPRTLNDDNYREFLDETGTPTSRAIVEGANLYLTPGARHALEELGVLIIKDSSANKGGVICSSFEVLTNLILKEEEFIKLKADLMPQILKIIRDRAQDEARLLLSAHAETGEPLTDLSERASEKINTYMYQLLDYLQGVTLSKDPNDPLIKCLINYCPPLLQNPKYHQRIIEQIPDIHKKAIIATYIASRLVYSRGLEWSPSIVDILPLIASDPDILGEE